MVKCLVTFICAQIGHKRTNPLLLFLAQIFFVIKSQKIKMAWFWFLGGLLFATRLYSTMLKENWNVERLSKIVGLNSSKKKNQNNKDFAQVFNPSKIKIGQNRVYKNKNKDKKLVGKRNRLFFFCLTMCFKIARNIFITEKSCSLSFFLVSLFNIFHYLIRLSTIV